MYVDYFNFNLLKLLLAVLWICVCYDVSVIGLNAFILVCLPLGAL